MQNATTAIIFKHPAITTATVEFSSELVVVVGVVVGVVAISLHMFGSGTLGLGSSSSSL